MVKLIKKTDKPTVKTSIWCVEKSNLGEKRKQFTCYGTSLSDIEELLNKEFREK